MEGRRPELEIGLRRKRGQRLMRPWLARLCAASGGRIPQSSLLPLEKSDQLRAAFFARVHVGPVARLFWDTKQVAEVQAALRDIGREFAPQVILFSQEDYLIGALLIDGSLVLDHPFDVMGAISSDLAIATPNLEDGLLLEYNHYGHVDNQSKDEYELTTWGRFSPRDEVATDGRPTSRYL